MQKHILAAMLALVAFSLPVSAKTYYVDASGGNDSNTGLKETLAFKTLQKAIEKAASGSTIIVAPGIYAPIVSGNKKLTIRSAEGADVTAIEGETYIINDSVYFSQTPLCDLGRHGKAKIYDWDEKGNRYWTGFYDEDAMLGGTATVIEGLMLRNAVNGAFGGTLSHCIISNLSQTAAWSAAVSDSSIVDNVQEHVYWSPEGAGALILGGTLNRCRIVNNAVVQGVWGATLLNSLVAGNRQDWTVPITNMVIDGVAGDYFDGTTDPHARRGDLIEGGTLMNCTVAENILKEIPLFKLEKVGDTPFGPWLEYKMTGVFSNGVAVVDADCSNCIVWNNRTDLAGNPADFARMGKKTMGNVVSAMDPLFRDLVCEDWRLLPWSPCRDAGADLTKKTGKFDIDGRPRKIGGAVDIGAFEHPQGVPVQADWDGDGKTDHATWNPDTFEWCIWESSTGVVRMEAFGEKGAAPVVADADGDGSLDLGYYTAAAATPEFAFLLADGTVMRKPLGLKSSSPLVMLDGGGGPAVLAAWSGTAKKPSFVFSDDRPAIVFGTKGATSLAADFDGDGTNDFAVYTSSASKPAFSVLSSGENYSDKALFPSGKAVELGVKGATPAVADWDGDGRADFGAYSGSAKAPSLYRVFSTSRWRELRTLPFGVKGAVAVPGYWVGDDRLADPAIVVGTRWIYIDSFFNPTESLF
ncbi:MAG: hypothetical protein ILM98_14535 [Kiritimatiellae bacterium]|nr:hypothetical protein [Kiritimatiellia bacterium]